MHKYKPALGNIYWYKSLWGSYSNIVIIVAIVADLAMPQFISTAKCDWPQWASVRQRAREYETGQGQQTNCSDQRNVSNERRIGWHGR